MLIVVCSFVAYGVSIRPKAATDGDFQFEVIDETKKEARITGYTGKEENLYIPEKLLGEYTIVEIGEQAFYGNDTLKNVWILAPIEEISDGAFSRCGQLQCVHSSQSKLRVVGNDAFSYCKNLSFVYLQTQIETIGERAFYNCGQLSSFYFGNSLKSIGQAAFSNCYNLDAVTLPDTLTSLCTEDATGEYGSVFYGCTRLKTVTLGRGITKIPPYTFYGCSSLKELVLPEQVTSIGEKAFAKCFSLINIQFPSGLTTIKEGAFYNCMNLQSLQVPDSVTIFNSTLENEGAVFGDCNSLKNVTVGSGITVIPQGTFMGCDKLEKVVLGSQVQRIEEKAFSGCNGLKEIYTLAKTVTIHKNFMETIPKELKIFYQDNAVILGVADEILYKFDSSKYLVNVKLLYNDDDNQVIQKQVLINQLMAQPQKGSKTGYTFLGWYLNPADEMPFDFNQKVVSQDMVLYGKWKINQYQIIFNPRGGVVSIDSKVGTYNEVVGTLPIPTREDYEFDGWYVGINGSGKKYEEDTPMEARDIHLYANWTLNPKLPSKPTVKVAEYSPIQIKLTWNKVSNASGYEVYRATSLNGKYTKVATTNASATGFINGKLTKGKTYYYKVRAFRTLEGQRFYGAYSSKVKVTLISKPPTPTLVVKRKNSTTTDLTWNVKYADGVEVYVKCGTKGTYKKFATYKSSYIGCYHKNLKKGSTYYYRVRAYANVNGKKVYSGYSTVKKITLPKK